MSNTVRELANWYPIIPIPDPSAVITPAPYEIARKITDARIRINVKPFATLEYLAYTQNAVKATIEAIEDDVAEIAVTSSAEPDIEGAELATSDGLWHVSMLVPVYEDIDSEPYADSFVIVPNSDITIPEALSGRLVLHPSCIEIRQLPPRLMLFDRGGVYSTDSNTETHVVTPVQTVYYASTSPHLVSGHNVSISVDGQALVFKGASAAGKGVYTEPPYVDPDVTYAVHKGRGMRSVNGFTGNVSIVGDASVLVTTQENEGDIEIHIIPFDVAEEDIADEADTNQ